MEFERESRVRDAVKKAAEEVFWVEAARGGTVGLPDAWVRWGGETGWIE